ncbi:MAG: DUF4199 domain-containing protein [Bacteroidota bacterium]
MWPIGIRSSIITLLLIMTYGLMLSMGLLKYVGSSNLGHVIFGLGIYSGHYYYKRACEGRLRYREAVQVGLIIVGITAGTIASLSYCIVKFVDPLLVSHTMEHMKSTLQQSHVDASRAETIIPALVSYLTPAGFALSIALTILIPGIILNLVIAVFSAGFAKK